MDEGNRDDESSEMKDNGVSRIREETMAYVKQIDLSLIDGLATIRSEISYIRGRVGDYLSQVLGQVLEQRDDSVGGEIEEPGPSEMSPELGIFTAYLTDRHQQLVKMREEADMHLGVLYRKREDALVVMGVAEAAIKEMHKEKPLLEARLEQKLDHEVRAAVEDEYDLLKDAWFFEGEKLADSTYTVELASNFLEVVRVYASNINNLLAEAEATKGTIASIFEGFTKVDISG